MNLPGFTAEASLGPAMDHYGGATIPGRSGGGVLPVQLSRLGSLFGQIRCCQFINGKFRCVSEVRRPWESCRCVRTIGGPVIICQDMVNQANF